MVMDAFGFSVRIMRVWGAKRVLSFEGYCYGFFPFFLFNRVDASKFKLIIRDLVRMMRGECILIINYGWSGREVSKRNFRV